MNKGKEPYKKIKKVLATGTNRRYNIIISGLSGLYGILMSQGRYVQKGDGKKVYLNYRHSNNSSDLVSGFILRLRRPAIIKNKKTPKICYFFYKRTTLLFIFPLYYPI